MWRRLLSVNDEGAREGVDGLGVIVAVVGAAGVEGAAGAHRGIGTAGVDVRGDAVADGDRLRACDGGRDVLDPRDDRRAGAPAGARWIDVALLVGDGRGGAVGSPHELLRHLRAKGDRVGLLAELRAVLEIALAVAGDER